MAQFSPCTTDPFSATTWRSAAVSSYQMARAREDILRSPSLIFTDAIRFCAYANRRICPGMGILMGAFDGEEASLGNWQKGQTMSAHYSAHNERLSFGIK